MTAYDERLMNSALSLCPFGSSPETYRLWESILSGAVVQWHPFSLFLVAAPLKMVPRKGSFFSPGSLN